MKSFWQKASDGHAPIEAPISNATSSKLKPSESAFRLPTLNEPPEPEEPVRDERADVLTKLCRTLAKELCAKLPHDVGNQPRQEVRRKVSQDLETLLVEHEALLDDEDQQRVVQMVLDEVFEFGPLTPLMSDRSISDILVNGPFQVFVEKNGQLQSAEICFNDNAHLMRIVQRMTGDTGRRLDKSSPMVDARLADGSRINAILNPPAINGPLISIRRFGSRPLTAEDLIKGGSISEEMLRFVSACVRSRLNIVIAGGTGSGKTTLLNALSRYIRQTERIATIEDTAELELQQPHLAKLEAHPADHAGQGEISIRALTKNALRMRPDRIIIGECRGAEVLEMLQAMNTGHEGSMTTIHANSPRDALSRMELMVALGGIEVPLSALRKQIASSINLIIHVSRQLGGTRRVVRISEITGMEGDTISMHDIFEFVQTGIFNDVAIGHFAATGIRPACYERLRSNGADIHADLFAQRRLETLAE